MTDQAPFLVTGGAGFIGSHLVDRLLAERRRVTVVDSFDPFYDPGLKRDNVAKWRGNPLLELVEGDLCDPSTLASLSRQRTWAAVIHLAARAGVRPSVPDPGPYLSNNLTATGNLLQWAAAQAEPPPVVFASSSSVYGDSAPAPHREDGPADPISPYGATKLAGEVLMDTWRRCYGLPTVSLRLFSVYGPRQRPDLALPRFVRSIAAGRPLPFFGDGSSARDYSYVSDVVGGILDAARRLAAGRLGHTVYNLGSDAPVTLREVVETVERVLERPAQLDRRPAQPGDVQRTWAHPDRSRQDLGYRPSVRFEDGVRSYAHWWRGREETP